LNILINLIALDDLFLEDLSPLEHEESADDDSEQDGDSIKEE